MNIRIYFPFFPFPITEGAYLVVADQVRHFAAQGHNVELVCWRESAEDIRRKVAKSKWPSNASWVLLGQGRESAVQRLSRVMRSIFSDYASPELFHYPPELIEDVLLLGPADLAIYHYSYAYVWLSQLSSAPVETKRVVHFHNIESDLHQLRKGALGWIHDRNAYKLQRHEHALARLSHELWFLSPLDASQLNAPNSRVVAPTLDPALRERRCASQPNEIVAAFIGAVHFQPNYESARWIMAELVPQLAQLGFNGKLLFVGRGMPEDLRKIGEAYRFVEFRGFVEDLETFWTELSFMLAPHIVGSGVRTKILESVASGVPVLTNAAGVSPLADDIRKSPFVMCFEHASDWARVLLQEPYPQATRRRLEGEPTCNALLANAVYESILNPPDPISNTPKLCSG